MRIELLMLLFVVQAELTDRPRAFVILRRARDIGHGLVDVAPIREHLGERRARQEPPVSARQVRHDGS